MPAPVTGGGCACRRAADKSAAVASAEPMDAPPGEPRELGGARFGTMTTGTKAACDPGRGAATSACCGGRASANILRSGAALPPRAVTKLDREERSLAGSTLGAPTAVETAMASAVPRRGGGGRALRLPDSSMVLRSFAWRGAAERRAADTAASAACRRGAASAVAGEGGGRPLCGAVERPLGRRGRGSEEPPGASATGGGMPSLVAFCSCNCCR